MGDDRHTVIPGQVTQLSGPERSEAAFDAAFDRLLASDAIAQTAVEFRSLGSPELADVTGCADCPMADGERDFCKHPNGQTHDIYEHAREGAGAPAGCPLRSAPLLVRLRVG
jgi:hypothetical protein